MIRNCDPTVFDDGSSNRYIALDQNAFIGSVLSRLNVNIKDFPTPMSSTINLIPNPDPKEDANPAMVRSYQSAIESLMYIMLGTRPDPAFVDQKLSSFLSNPSVDHRRPITHVFGYLNRTKHTSLMYFFDTNPITGIPIGYCDADWANDKGKGEKRHSVSGNVFFIQSGPFSWSSKKQELTAKSTTEAEYISLWLAGRQSTWIRSILETVSLPMEKPLCIMSDSQSAIALATRGEASHKGSKHFDVKSHATRDRVEQNKIEIKFCPTEEQVADGLTKPLPHERFQQMTKSFALINSSLLPYD